MGLFPVFWYAIFGRYCIFTGYYLLYKCDILCEKWSGPIWPRPFSLPKGTDKIEIRDKLCYNIF
jgi:hypothetical protein